MVRAAKGAEHSLNWPPKSLHRNKENGKWNTSDMKELKLNHQQNHHRKR